MTILDFIGFGALNVDKLFKVNHIAHAEGESYITTHSETCGGSAGLSDRASRDLPKVGRTS